MDRNWCQKYGGKMMSKYGAKNNIKSLELKIMSNVWS